VRPFQGRDVVVGWWTFCGGVAPAYVTSALSGRVPQQIQDLPRLLQHLLHTRHSEPNKFAPSNAHVRSPEFSIERAGCQRSLKGEPRCEPTC
jgi:hypothetical protein